MPIQPICLIFEVIGLDWQACLAGSSKKAHRIFISSIALDADLSLELNSIVSQAPTFSSYDKLFSRQCAEGPLEIGISTSFFGLSSW